MRRTLVALLVALVPTVAMAQVNTTGTISPNTTVSQTQSPSTTTTTTGTGSATTTAPTTATTPSTTAPAAPRDAAIVICAQDLSTGALVVFTSSVSTGGPAIAPGAACAQALSDLFVAGFGIIDVQPFNQQVQYTLVR
jgi:hypothetical protein